MTTDAELTAAVEKALVTDKATSPYPIEVAVSGGTVTLTGEVEHQKDKDEAERAARGVAGVVGVINEMVVRSHHTDALFGIFGDSGEESTPGERSTSDAGPFAIGDIMGTRRDHVEEEA